MKLTTLTIILLVIISSCTIEKRLYNRGWNVQWRKYQSSSNSENEVVEKTRIEFRSEQNTSSLEETEKVGSEAEMEQVFAEDWAEENELVEIPTTCYQRPEDTTEKTVKTPSPYADMSTSRDRRPRTVGTSFPTTLMILGALAIIGAVLLYFAIGTMSDAFVVVFTVLAMLGLGIIGIMLLFMGLIMLLAAVNGR